MTSQEMREALDALGYSRKAFAELMAELTGKPMSANYVSDMCSDREGSREPSSPVRVALRLLLQNQANERLRRAVERAGWKRERQ